MSIFGRIFGTQKAIDNVMDKDNGLLTKVGSWVGNMQFTSEEKSEANERTRDWGLKQLEALAPFKVVQRILAFAAASLWIFVGLNVVAAIWLDPVSMVDGTKIGGHTRDAMMQFAMSDYVFWPVAVVFALYFSGGVINSLKGSKQ